MHQIFSFKLKKLFSPVGTDDDLVTTSTLSTMYRLEKEDEIFLTLETEKNHGESKLVSNSKSPGIQFIGQRISD